MDHRFSTEREELWKGFITCGAWALRMEVAPICVHLRPSAARINHKTMPELSRRATTDIKARMVELARRTLALGIDDLTAMLYYLVGEFDPETTRLLGEVLDEVVPGQKERLMQTVGDLLVAQGEARGEAKGRAEGVARLQSILLRQLRRRFGEFSGEVVDRIQAADMDQLDQWSERFVNAKTVEDVFNDDRRH